MTAILRELLGNWRAFVFVGGCAVLYAGIAGFSKPAANVAAGLLFMAIGAARYLFRSRKG